MPSGAGYRIYQSYFQAYSLKAWLSNSTVGLFDADFGDIMVFGELKEQVNIIIQKFTNNKHNLTSGFENATDFPDEFKPFCLFVKNYNETTAMNNFIKAWNVYGQGKVISWAQMEDYINKVADMTIYFDKYANTADLFSEKIYNDWTDLFGSPNPVHFPNLAYNAIHQNLFQERVYRFEILVSKFKESDCDNHFYYINL